MVKKNDLACNILLLYLRHLEKEHNINLNLQPINYTEDVTDVHPRKRNDLPLIKLVLENEGTGEQESFTQNIALDRVISTITYLDHITCNYPKMDAKTLAGYTIHTEYIQEFLFFIHLFETSDNDQMKETMKQKILCKLVSWNNHMSHSKKYIMYEEFTSLP